MAGWIERVFDAVERPIEATWARRWFSTGLLGLFAVSLVVIEANRRFALPGLLEARVPTIHFAAVELAFSVILFFEVVEMALGIGRSLSLALGRQFVVFALILLRSAIKELGNLPEPISWDAAQGSLTRVLGDAVGGLAVFGILGVYFWLIQRRPRLADVERDRGFVVMKKALALVLLATFALIAVQDLWRLVAHGRESRFFEALYTVLVFGDVVLVLISLRYTTSYHVVFRNSAFAVASVILRFALTAPPPWNAALGVAGALYATGVVWIHCRVAPLYEEVEHAGAVAGGPTR